MSPNETLVLRIVQEEENPNKRLISKRMAISSDYASYLCDSLIRGNYLRKIGKGYKLTPKGEGFLVNLLYADKERLEAEKKKIEWAKERVDKKIGQLKEELKIRESEK